MKRGGTNLVFIIILSCFLFIHYSCKEVNPVNASDNITLRIIVNDKSGNPIPNSAIWIANGANVSSNNLELKGFTDYSGSFSIVLPKVNCKEGTLFTLEIKPPLGDTILGGCRYDSLRLVCCDTTITCNDFTKNVNIVNCKKQIYNQNIDITFCLDTANVSTRISRSFVNQTGGKWTVFFLSPNPPPPDELEIKAINLNTLQSSIVPCQLSVLDNQNFICSFVLSTSKPVNEYKGTMTFIALSDSLNDTCFVGNLQIMAQADICNTCNCPDSDYIYLYSDTVCVKNSCESGTKKISIPINLTNKMDCPLTLTLSNDFINNTEIKLLSYNNYYGADTITLKPGQKLLSLEVKVTPNQPKSVIDSVVYSLSFVNKFGQKIYCTKKLKIITKFIFMNPLPIGIRLADSVLIQCVDSDTFIGLLCIKNNSPCELPIKTDIIGPDAKFFKISPKDTCIFPGKEQCFKIGFLPVKSSVWPNGRPNQPVKLNYFSQIKITSSVEGIDTTLNLTGIADTTCGDVFICIREYGGCGGKKDGIVFQKDYNYQVYNPIEPNNCDIYAVSLDPNSQTGTLISNNGGKFIKYSFSTSTLGSNSALCPWVNASSLNPSPEDICRTFSNLPSTDTLNVKQGDFFVFKSASGKCCLGWVNSIFVDANGCTTICMNFCVNIHY